MRWVKRTGWILGGAIVALLLVAQLVPYGRDHTNPPVRREPAWNSPATRALAVRVCFDCHSNETHWPWYANVAPMSWIVQRDVEAARSIVNYSEMNIPQDLASYSGLSVRSGGMPPTKYTVAHPEARLTEAEIEELARGLDITLKVDHARR